MPLLAELIDIPESVQRDDFVLKLSNGVHRRRLGFVECR
jgi:hypothetical protein